MTRPWLPPTLLAAYGLAFAWKALGGGLLMFDDHPGQVYRLSQVFTEGLAPWRLNPGWWAGYAELQFYPPGFSYAGAILHYASLGSLDLGETYRLLLWVTFLLPGVGAYVLLVRILGNAWLALPGAFLALTLSAGSRSGVEEGLRWGLVAARLGWGLLPPLALSLHRWVETGLPPIVAAPLLAAIVLVHPAHVPAGLALVLLAAAHAPGPARARACHAALLVSGALGLAAFWLLPLLAHLGMALPLAWGDASLPALTRAVAGRSLLILLVVASALGWWAARSPRCPRERRWLGDWAPAVAAVMLLDAIVAQPLGVMWIPADRILDSFLLALIVGSSLALARLSERMARLPIPGLALAAIVTCALLAEGGGEPALSLWPASWPNEWPKYAAIARIGHLPDLWDALRKAPPGRVLFVRSALPLENRPDWRRPHSHVTALAPIATGRWILNGTFTHPSPIAGLFYAGTADNRPITGLVEQRDGLTLFGRPLEELSARTFNELAVPLRVSAVVALDEDQARLGFLSANPALTGPARIGPFLLFTLREARALPQPIGPQHWRLGVPEPDDGWLSTGMAYSPLWRSHAGGRPLPIRRGPLGLLEVRTSAGRPLVVQLEHRPGAIEWIGVWLSAAAALALLAFRYRQVGG